MGHLPRRRGGGQRRVDEDQLVASPRPQRRPDGGQGHRHVRELVAGQGGGAQGRLRRGHPPGPGRQRQRVHRREHLHRPQGPPDHPADLRLGRPARASPSSRSRPSPATSATGVLRADHPHRPLHRRRGLPDRHGGRGGADPGGRRPAGGRRTSRARSPRSSSRPTSPPSAARSTSTRTGWTMSNDGPTLNDDSFPGRSGPGRSCPLPRQRTRPQPSADPGPARPRRRAGRPRGPSAEGRRPRLRPARPSRRGRRLRHHPAGRLPAGGALADRGRQAAGGRAARPPGGDLHRGRVARGQSEGRGVLRPGPDRALAVHGRPWWPSAPPGGPG